MQMANLGIIAAAVVLGIVIFLFVAVVNFVGSQFDYNLAFVIFCVMHDNLRLLLFCSVLFGYILQSIFMLNLFNCFAAIFI